MLVQGAFSCLLLFWLYQKKKKKQSKISIQPHAVNIIILVTPIYFKKFVIVFLLVYGNDWSYISFKHGIHEYGIKTFSCLPFFPAFNVPLVSIMTLYSKIYCLEMLAMPLFCYLKSNCMSKVINKSKIKCNECG